MSEGDSSNKAGAGTVSSTLVVAAHVLGFAATWLTILVVQGGPDELVEWYTDGGFFMHPLVLVSLAQLVGGIVLGLLNLRKTLPLTVHLALPAVAACLGLLGAWVGLQQGVGALASAPKDMAFQMWGAILAILDIPRQLGFTVAGYGAVAVCVTGFATLLARRLPVDRDQTQRPTGRWLAVLGCALVAAASAIVVATVSHANSVNGIALSVWLIALSLLGVGLSAAGARFLSAASGEGPSGSRPTAVNLVLCATAALLSVVALGIATHGQYLTQLYGAIAGAPPSPTPEEGETVSSLFAGLMALRGITLGLGIALLVFVGVVSARKAMLASLSDKRVLLDLSVAAGIVVVVVVGSVALNRQEHAGQAQLETLLKRPMPTRTLLPTSTSGLLPSEDPLLEVSEGRILLDEKPMGRVEDPATLETLVEAVGKNKRALKRCGHDELGIVRLAVDKSENATAVQEVLHRWWTEGGCRIKLMVEEPQTEEDKRRDALFSRLGVFGDYMALISRPTVINVYLSDDYRSGSDLTDERPSPNLTLEVSDDRIGVAKNGEPAQALAGKTGGLPLALLQERLVHLKEAFPEERRVFLRPQGAITMQDLVAVLDFAITAKDPSGTSRVLFDDVTWLLPKDGSAHP